MKTFDQLYSESIVAIGIALDNDFRHTNVTPGDISNVVSNIAGLHRAEAIIQRMQESRLCTIYSNSSLKFSEDFFNVYEKYYVKSAKSKSYSDADEFDPLPIDRENPDAADHLENISESIHKIESDNAFASQEPDIRNAIVGTLRAGEKLVEGSVAEEVAIRASLVRPFKYIAERFVGSAIGEAAKIGLKAVLALFGWSS